MTKLESGRSMVEMLGVLAIIGVLSIGGIMGYSMAMNRKKANDVLAAAAQLAVVADTVNQGDGTTETLHFDAIGVAADTNGAYKVEGATADATKAKGGNPTVTLKGLDADVATIIKEITGVSNCTATSCGLTMTNGSF